MPALVKITDQVPLVARHIVNLALFGRLIRVLAANSIDVIFGFVFESPVQMCQLVAALAIPH